MLNTRSSRFCPPFTFPGTPPPPPPAPPDDALEPATHGRRRRRRERERERETERERGMRSPRKDRGREKQACGSCAGWNTRAPLTFGSTLDTKLEFTKKVSDEIQFGTADEFVFFHDECGQLFELGRSRDAVVDEAFDAHPLYPRIFNRLHDITIIIVCKRFLLVVDQNRQLVRARNNGPGFVLCKCERRKRAFISMSNCYTMTKRGEQRGLHGPLPRPRDRYLGNSLPKLSRRGDVGSLLSPLDDVIHHCI